jgi:5-methyltetrahydropteroyltriglutamate--homocysteine methyltransferase
MFQTSTAGSLPKPEWLAEPGKLWAPWRLSGAELASAKRDATLLWLKEQEDVGLDVVTDGEQSRQHFVHGFLEFIDGIDFANKVKMGIRNNRYDAMVPVVTGPLRLRGRVHATEARLMRAHTKKKIKFTLPGPMTIVDTIADRHYGDKVKLAMAVAALLNREARALVADGVDIIQFDEPAFNVYMDEVTTWGIVRSTVSNARRSFIFVTAMAFKRILIGRRRLAHNGASTKPFFRHSPKAALIKCR